MFTTWREKPALFAMHPNVIKAVSGVVDMPDTKTAAGCAILNSRTKTDPIARNTSYTRMSAVFANRMQRKKKTIPLRVMKGMRMETDYFVMSTVFLKSSAPSASLFLLQNLSREPR